MKLRPVPAEFDIFSRIQGAEYILQQLRLDDNPNEDQDLEYLRRAFDEYAPALRRRYAAQRRKYAFTPEQATLIERILDGWTEATLAERIAVSRTLRLRIGERS